MNLTFKVTLQKSWTLLEDRLIYGGREILLTKIQLVKGFTKSNFLTNGEIQIVVGGKIIKLAYPHKLREDAEKAIAYIENNYDCSEELKNRKKVSDIADEINAIPYQDAWGIKKEIAELANILGANEHIKAMTSGRAGENTWLIVCTNKRVLMLDKGVIYRSTLIDIPLDRINSISHSKGLLLGKISITDGATTRTIDNVVNTTVSFFTDTVNKEIEMYKQAKNNPVARVVNTTSLADELIKYKQLLDMDVLTQEEFDMKKKELLNL